MGNDAEQDLGLALLGLGSSFGVWSSLNTSPVGVVQFAINNPEVAYKGMNLSLAVILAMAAGIGLYYKKKGLVAAAVTGATGVCMWLWYDNLIKTHSRTLQNQAANLQISGFLPLSQGVMA